MFSPGRNDDGRVDNPGWYPLSAVNDFLGPGAEAQEPGKALGAACVPHLLLWMRLVERTRVWDVRWDAARGFSVSLKKKKKKKTKPNNSKTCAESEITYFPPRFGDTRCFLLL